MATNFAELTPQQRGVIVANAQANQFPEGSREREELIEIINAGLDAIEAMDQPPNNDQFPPQGRLNSRRQKPSPQERAKQVAQQMLEAGKTPQEIGAVVAAILGFNQQS